MGGKEIRAQIDTENVKGLLLINGGGAVALLAFLPSVLSNPDYEPLTRKILYGIFLCSMGLISALIHNHLRRRCSLAYESSKPKHKLFGLGLSEPWVCHSSHLFMYASYGVFAVAAICVFLGGREVLNSGKQSPARNTATRIDVNTDENVTMDVNVPESSNK